MSKFRDLTTIALTVFGAVILQLLFVSAELKETPDRAAVAFAKAYYGLDVSMENRICTEILGAGDPVGDLIHRASVEADQRGYSLGYMKSQLFHIRSAIIEHDQDSAQIALAFERKKAIHPVFAYFAKMWKIGDTHHEEMVIDLILEDGKWKVCNGEIFQSI